MIKRPRNNIAIARGESILSPSISSTLSSSSSSYSLSFKSFILGVKWGIGHSLGLITVGGVLIALQAESGNEWITMNNMQSIIVEGIVGSLGWYGMLKAVRHKEENTSDMM